ncbi:uncharacterized protein EI90DRAFT_3071005 [Cantharellus anzutake]|uniref:uncharacterized protein n=1 Tax=Cantharellus anzutake TaxID=1750568 RepID=UPI001907EB11|nr:uncharacterized protein EI90DRAFT_3071005 [Cantharellus anzutake]KAF8326214.1 hypothetical protein EI90DRAFT_3071005 [Cantharellus anzutake]
MQLWEARWDLRWGADGIDEYNDYDVYRSCLPFTPSSSPIYKLYGHLTDPIRVFSIDGEFGGHVIPLSQDALNALKITEVELNELPKKVDRGDPDVVIDYEAEFCDHNVHNGIVTCATLSPDGHFIALGFGSGAIEIANIDHQCTISQFQCNPPSHLVWIKFCNGNHWIATEDSGGNIVIFGDDIQPLRLGTLPSDLCPPVAAVSDSGSMVLRAPGELHEGCNDITLLYISCDPSIQLLAWPPLEFPETPTPSLGFSPGGRYVAVHFSHNIFVWSTDSCKLITRYRFPDSVRWVLSAGVVPTSSYVTPELVHPKLATSSISEKNPGFVQNSQRDLGQNTDESWMESPFYGFEAASLSEIIEHLSSTVGRVPIIDKFNIWFNGGDELVLPQEYRPAYYSNGAWYGDRVLNSDYPYFPPASKDGTRFIVQGKMTAPIIIDISQVV